MRGKDSFFRDLPFKHILLYIHIDLFRALGFGFRVLGLYIYIDLEGFQGCTPKIP